jgi:hypothetical protein
MEESDASRAKREAEAAAKVQAEREAAAAARRAAEERRKIIDEILDTGNLFWSPDVHAPEVRVLVDRVEMASLVVNTGTMDQWAPVRAHAAVYEGRGFFAVRVEALPQSQNTWRVRRFRCVSPCVKCFMTMSRD